MNIQHNPKNKTLFLHENSFEMKMNFYENIAY